MTNTETRVQARVTDVKPALNVNGRGVQVKLVELFGPESRAWLWTMDEPAPVVGRSVYVHLRPGTDDIVGIEYSELANSKDLRPAR